ncbi:serine protease SP24D [Aedes aegypti]|uniref:Uncharacterized protein n=1 Tax=Aedes aegypti TaxID=7159 RepID=A0A1S4FM46_AEDAE|nr:serine protease SP24D [Aedes aegypti]
MSQLNGSGHSPIMLLPLLLVVASLWTAAAFDGNLVTVEEARSNAVDSSSPPARIVGGSSASLNQFPHQVALLRQGSLFCGGSLITSKWVLTAAHCVYDGNQVVQPSLLTVLAGTVNLNQGGVRRSVRRIIPHERYGNFRNDIAVMELQQAYQIGRSISTITLRRMAVPNGSTVTISGWGRLYNNGPFPNTLQYTRVTALSSLACARETGFNGGILCLRSPVNNGACNGDSGGPAVYNNQLVGVANFVINGCGSSRPDGYAQVSDFVQWIETRIN